MKRRITVFSLIAVILVTLIAGGCGGTPPSAAPYDHLLLTMSFDDDPDGYYQGEQVNVYFLEDYRFRLEDKYGTFEGDYTWKPDKNELTLDYDDYPA